MNDPRLKRTERGAYIHELAVVHSPDLLGEGTVIWQFCTLMPGVVTGKQCSVGSSSYIGKNTRLGDHVRMGDKVHVTDHMTVGAHVFIAPEVVLANDRYPVVNNPAFARESPIVEDHVAIGVNATILPGVRLGRGCLVGAGSVVTKDVAPWTVVLGNPAKVVRELELRMEVGLDD